MKETGGRENQSLAIHLRHYDEFVEKLKAGPPRRSPPQKARKALLATTDFEDKELGFTEGQLTQSSHLMKLAMGALKQKLPSAAIDPIPGPVTSEIRKAWKLTGTLSLACPEVIDSGDKVRPKNEIRGLTHLHHALDAATLGLAAHYFPLRHRGRIRQGKSGRPCSNASDSEEEKKFLRGLGIFVTYGRLRRDKDGNPYEEKDVRLDDLAETDRRTARAAPSRNAGSCSTFRRIVPGLKRNSRPGELFPSMPKATTLASPCVQRTSKVKDGRPRSRSKIPRGTLREASWTRSQKR